MKLTIAGLMLLLALPGCPQPEDPGPTPVSTATRPEASEPAFPDEIPSPAARIDGDIHWLEYGNARRLGKALARLERAGKRAVPALIRFLEVRGEANSRIVTNALRALESIGDPAGTPAAAAWADNESSAIRERVVETVAACGGEGAEAILITALDDASPRVVGRALNGLGRIGTERAGAAILYRRVRHGPGLTALSATALGKIGAREAIPWLRELLAETSGIEVRIQAALALHAMGDDAGLDTLAREAARNHDLTWPAKVAVLLSEGHPEGRRLIEAARASGVPAEADEARLLALAYPAVGNEADVLAELASGDASRTRFALGFATDWLKAGNEAIAVRLVEILVSATDLGFRAVAARALAESGRPELLDRLAVELRDRPGEDPGNAGYAVAVGSALARAGDEGRARLLPLLGSSHEVTVAGALVGIVRAGRAADAEAVARLLESDHRATRFRAVGALVSLGSARAIPALREAHRKERDPELRAAYALGAREILGPADGD